MDLEAANSFRAGWVAVGIVFGELILSLLVLLVGVGAETEFVVPEAHLFGWHVASKEYVDSVPHGEWH